MGFASAIYTNYRSQLKVAFELILHLSLIYLLHTTVAQGLEVINLRKYVIIGTLRINPPSGTHIMIIIHICTVLSLGVSQSVPVYCDIK